jgi:4-amino-4-deoxy-L-arabinose transferase-like glycosyltransferase
MLKTIITKRNKLREHLALSLILVIASFLLFSNLGSHYLWQDEAETALVGATILDRGYPIGTDGRNSFSQDSLGDKRKYDPWRLHPWLQFYFVAGSFSILGPSTLSARLPFALIGLGVIIATYFFTRSIFRNGSVALIAATLLSFSIPFLILSRQSRYYSALMLFSILTFWSYFLLIRGSKKAFPAFIAASTLCFHSFYPTLLILLGVLCLHSVLFYRHKLKSLFKALALFALINLPWFIWFRAYPGIRRNVSNPSRIIEQLTAISSEIFEYVFPPWMLIIALALIMIHILSPRKINMPLREWWSPAFLLASASLIMVAAYSVPAHSFFRYLSPVIPFLSILSALIIYAAFKVQRLFGFLIITLLIWMQPLHDFYFELTHDYQGPMKGIAHYLNQHAAQNDIVLITYGDLTLKFYTKLRVLGGYTGENLEPARNANWIVIRKHMNSPYEIPVRRFIEEKISLSDYERIPIDYPDIAYENRESPHTHHFRTVQSEDKVVIYKKLNGNFKIPILARRFNN